MQHISVQDLYKKMAEGPEVIIDVRTPQEHAEGHIPGAKNIVLQDILSYADDLKTKSAVYVHCQTGGRSSNACLQLASRGLTNVWNIDGGLSAWQGAGYPVER